MLPWLTDAHANPHAEHRHGQHAAAAVEQARAHVAALIGADSENVIFTSGATESNNLALQGLLGETESGRVLAVNAAAHKSILGVSHALAHRGVRVVALPIDDTAAVTISDANALLESLPGVDVGVVSVTHGNNEVGTVQSLPPIAELAHRHAFFLHVDASQSAGRLPFDVTACEADLASLSSHKMYGPAGIGALYLHPDVARQIRPVMFGGGQERGLRPGTVPVFLAVGFGAAAHLAKRSMVQDAEHLRRLTDHFLALLGASQLDFRIVGDGMQRLPGHLSLYLPQIDAATLLDSVSGEISASTGSACTAGQLRSSHVLRAVGFSEEQARQVVRITLGRSSRVADVERACAALLAGVQRQFLLAS